MMREAVFAAVVAALLAPALAAAALEDPRPDPPVTRHVGPVFAGKVLVANGHGAYLRRGAARFAELDEGETLQFGDQVFGQKARSSDPEPIIVLELAEKSKVRLLGGSGVFISLNRAKGMPDELQLDAGRGGALSVEASGASRPYKLRIKMGSAEVTAVRGSVALLSADTSCPGSVFVAANGGSATVRAGVAGPAVTLGENEGTSVPVQGPPEPAAAPGWSDEFPWSLNDETTDVQEARAKLPCPSAATPR